MTNAKIKGVPTEAAKAKARAKAKGPKQGQAQLNQTAKLSAEALDAIAFSKATAGGDSHHVGSVGGKSVTFPTSRWAGTIRKMSAIGASFAALELELAKEPAQPKLARGVTGRDAPHSSKAVADNNRAASKGAKAAAKPVAASKAAKPGTAPKTRSDKRSARIELLVKPADTNLKGGRLAKLEAVFKRKPKTVSDIVGTVVTDSSGKTHTLDMGAINGMAKRGHIKLVAA